MFLATFLLNVEMVEKDVEIEIVLKENVYIYSCKYARFKGCNKKMWPVLKCSFLM